MSTDAKAGLVMVLGVLFLIALGLWGCPQYNVYSARMDGEAKLAHANSEREVQVRDAQGKFEASSMLAKAEIERAKGVAEANKIIGTSLKGNEEYLRYLWIHNLNEGKNEVIYVPTEAGLPILEATRKQKPVTVEAQK
jgi:regulator of protease activity HflC (stomatin/prohibitin superfamily)